VQSFRQTSKSGQRQIELDLQLRDSRELDLQLVFGLRKAPVDG
jgi:hypothetical protein